MFTTIMIFNINISLGARTFKKCICPGLFRSTFKTIFAQLTIIRIITGVFDALSTPISSALFTLKGGLIDKPSLFAPKALCARVTDNAAPLPILTFLYPEGNGCQNKKKIDFTYHPICSNWMQEIIFILFSNQQLEYQILLRIFLCKMKLFSEKIINSTFCQRRKIFLVGIHIKQLLVLCSLEIAWANIL